jgi:hypothetical protein
MRTNLIKIGDIIHNYTRVRMGLALEDPKSISFIMIDIDNKDKNISELSKYVLSNQEFVDKYKIMRSKDIVRIEKHNIENLNLGSKTDRGTIKEVIDFIVITEANIYVIDDISYYRDIKLKKLGL